MVAFVETKDIADMNMGPHSARSLNVIYGIVLVLMCLIHSAVPSTVTCPKMCSCSSNINVITGEKVSVVNCEQFQTTSWGQFLSYLPPNTRILNVQDAEFFSFDISTDVASTFSLPALDFINISHSLLPSVMATAFSYSPNLKELHLVNSNVANIDSKSMSHLVTLQVLNISGNQLLNLEPDLFANLQQLQVLDLHNNSLADIPNTIFQSLTRLEELDLSDNGLEYIHPESFTNLTELSKVYLHSNRLHTLHSSLFANLSSLQKVYLHLNPWDCSCSLEWLRTKLAMAETSTVISSPEEIICNSPSSLYYKPLNLLAKEDLICLQPEISDVPSDQEIMRLQNAILKCNVSGYPKPSIYWVTPGGVLAQPQHRKYISPDISPFHVQKKYRSPPHYHDSRLTMLDDGSLEIHIMKHYFAGEYQCVAENPVGIVMIGFNVTVGCAIPDTVVDSIIVGWIALGGFLVFGILVGSIRIAIDTRCGRNKDKLKNCIDVESPDVSDTLSSYKSTSPSPSLSSRSSPEMYPSYDVSPLKCTTPVEDIDEDDLPPEIVNIRETLEDVRTRLRSGVEKSKERIRTRAHLLKENSSMKLQTLKESSSIKLQTLKENSSLKLQTLKENSTLKLHSLRHSSSQYMTHIRESGSQYAHRVRDGVVLGVEQVKYHVQSIKELCGTGDIGQTISTISVATDVDSQEQTEVIRKITLV